MLSRRARILLVATGVCAAVLPAVASQPGGGLPPGFGDPKAAPPPPPPPPTLPPPPSPADQVPPGFTPAPPPPPPPPPPPARRPERAPIETEDSALTDLELLPPPPPPPFYDLPEGLERPVDVVGLINSANRGLPIDAFGNANGGFLATLMQRLDAPMPSRWTHILLRRALMSRVTAPPGLDPVDFAAERVRLLLRMGEADAARMLAQAIDISRYNPNMVRAAFEASMASSDPAGLCPLVEKGRAAYRDPVWPMAAAICAALEGEGARASTLLDEARSQGARGIDLLLAEKIIGAGSESRRSVEVQWEDVTEINPWRYGMATAAGLAVPERLLASGGPTMRAWMARAPMVPLAERLGAAEVAAALGVFSAASLIDAHALAMELREASGEPMESEGAEAGTTLAERLRNASTGALDGRIVALREIWNAEEDPLLRHASLIATAGAAALVPPLEERVEDADEIIAALFTAGMDGEAARWAPVVEAQGDSSLGWALLAVGAPSPAVAIDGDRIEAFAGGDNGALRARMLAAALAGLGRVDEGVARELGVDTGFTNVWTQALERAASAGSGGTVALLAAIGMQVADWSEVPPEHLFHITRALRQVGLEFEARMIAAEAMTRL